MIAMTLRGLAERRLRTLLTAMAIVLGVAMVGASFTISDTMKRGADSLSASAYDGTAAVVSTPSLVDSDDFALERAPVAAEVVEQIKAVPGVQTTVGDVMGEARVIDAEGEVVGDGPFFGAGLDPSAVELTPFHLVDGGWAAGAGQVVIDQGTAGKEGYEVGDTVTIAGRGPARQFEVAGIVRFGTVKTIGHATVALFDVRTAQQVVGPTEGYDQVLVGAAPGTDAAGLRETIARMLGPDYQVQTAAEHDRFTLSSLSEFIDVLGVILLIFGIIAIVVGGATILNALSITVAQRSRELALLRSLGAERTQVRRSVLAEAALIGVGASVAGIAAGYGLAAGLTGLLAGMGLDLPQAGMAFSASAAVIAGGVGIGVTLLAALVPARRATRVSPIEAMRADVATGGGIVRRGLRRVAQGLVSVLGRPAERMGASGFLARRNAMRHPGRTAATSAALAIGVTLVVAVATLGAAIQDTTRGEALRAVGSSLVVDDVSWGTVDEKAIGVLASAPGVEEVQAYRSSPAVAFGEEVAVDGIAPFDKVQPGEAVVSKAFADEHGLAAGDAFSVTSPDGRDLPLTVAAVEDHGGVNPLMLGDVQVAQATFAKAFAESRVSFALVDAPGVTPGTLEAELGGFPNVSVRSADEYADYAAGAFTMVLAIFNVLLALAVIVSIFGIVNTLVLAVLERTREIGLLRAAGMSRRQVRRMIRQESIITALTGTAFGVGFGLALGALAVSLVPITGLAFTVPSGTLIAVSIVAVVLGTVAAIVPARRAARMNVLAAVAHA